MGNLVHANFKTKKKSKYQIGDRVFILGMGAGTVERIENDVRWGLIYIIRRDMGGIAWMSDVDLKPPQGPQGLA